MPEPTVRVTPKGLAELHKRLGGSGIVIQGQSERNDQGSFVVVGEAYATAPAHLGVSPPRVVRRKLTDCGTAGTNIRLPGWVQPRWRSPSSGEPCFQSAAGSKPNCRRFVGLL